MKDCRQCQGCGLVKKAGCWVPDEKGKKIFGVTPCSCQPPKKAEP